MAEGQSQQKRRLYGRRHGHRLKPSQQASLTRRLPELAIALAETDASVDPQTLFPQSPDAIWLEIGFGGGEHLIWQAQAHPGIGFLGCEPFVNGLARLLRCVEEENLQNIRVFPDDARLLLAALPDACLGRVFLLFPDPWPKTRHHKRRFVSAENLQMLARVMKGGAELRLASDDMGYVGWMLHHLLADANFTWEALGPADWRVRPADWPETRYEAKAICQDRRPAYLRFRRCLRQ
ncbi:MAG: tRNA (guanosine(46)-N7)-methyltransferase TrmB [Rhodospirillaceae bacterium]|nr:MAG: tRNA (guanosine(46)-N7)-methyltransferase TrmB [Rhodospirillaceae bacterium]